MISKGMLAALALLLPASAAMAEPGGITRLERLMHEQLSKGAPQAAKKAAVTRSAALKLEGRINPVGSFTRPLRCYFYFSYYDGTNYFSERKDVEVTFQGGEGKCEMRVPFRWSVADDSLTIGLHVAVTNLPEEIRQLTVLKADEPPIYRGMDMGLGDIPLPAQGETATVTFNTNL